MRDEDVLANEFVRLVLDGEPVMPQAWDVGVRVARVAIRTAHRVVPVDEVPRLFDESMRRAGAQVISKQKYDELFAALESFGMKEFATDSPKLRRLKAAYRDMQFDRHPLRVPPGEYGGLPMPSKEDLK